MNVTISAFHFLVLLFLFSCNSLFACQINTAFNFIEKLSSIIFFLRILRILIINIIQRLSSSRINMQQFPSLLTSFPHSFTSDPIACSVINLFPELAIFPLCILAQVELMHSSASCIQSQTLTEHLCRVPTSLALAKLHNEDPPWREFTKM